MTIFYSRSKTDSFRGRISIRKSFYNILLTLTLAGIVLFSGCEEDPSQIGAEVLPGEDLNILGAIDTFGIDSYTSYLETIKSYYADSTGSVFKPNTYYLGASYSPYFGLTEAGFITQLWLLKEWPKDHLTLDSAKMYLHISGVDGELPVDQTVNMYEIDEYLSEDSVYYLNKDIPIKQYLGSFSLGGITDTDSVIYIRMPATFILELMRDTTQIFLDENEPDFRKYFKGLYFEYPQTEGHHLVKINLNGGFSGLSLYYTDTALTSRSFMFLFNSKTVSFNVLKHDFSAAEPGNEIQHINDEFQDTVSYIQGYNGLFTTLRIPGLESLKDSLPLGINKARLYLPVYSDDNYFVEDNFPTTLLARYKDADGNRYTTRDYLLNSSFADGQYYSLDGYYVINITGFVQDYLDGIITDPELEIVFNTYGGEGMALWSRSSDNPPRLELVYTKM